MESAAARPWLPCPKGEREGEREGAARSVRQKESGCRCCLPALAGFARP